MSNPVNNVNIHSDTVADFISNNADELVEKVDPADQEVAASGLASRAGKIWPNWADDAFKRISQVFNADVWINALKTKGFKFKTHTDLGNDPDTEVDHISIGQQITTQNGNTDTTLFTVDDTTDALYRFEVSITAFLDGNAGQYDSETWTVLVDVTTGSPAIAGTEQSSDEKGAPAFEIDSFVLSGNNVQVRITDTSAQTVNLMGDIKYQRMEENITP